jgi:hypothetical protein
MNGHVGEGAAGPVSRIRKSPAETVMMAKASPDLLSSHETDLP